MASNTFNPLVRALGDRQEVLVCGFWGAQVREVNPETHTYSVSIDGGGDPIELPLMSPYFSNERGQGYTAVASPGTRCIVARTVHNEWFIAGFLAPIGTKPPKTTSKAGLTNEEKVISEQKTESSYRGRAGNRTEDLKINDQEMCGPAGNSIRVRASGRVELISIDGQLLTRWINVPGQNVVQTLSDWIETILPAGTYVWRSDTENDAGYFKWEIKSVLSDDEPDVIFKGGNLPEDDADAGQKVVVLVRSEVKNVKIAISASGDVKIEAQDLTIESDGEIQVNCEKANVKAESSVQIEAQEIRLN